MRAARFEVANELLREALHLPPSATIEHVVSSGDYGRTTFVVSDYTIPEAPSPHHCTPILTDHRVEWNWNIEEIPPMPQTETPTREELVNAINRGIKRYKRRAFTSVSGAFLPEDLADALIDAFPALFSVVRPDPQPWRGWHARDNPPTSNRNAKEFPA